MQVRLSDLHCACAPRVERHHRHVKSTSAPMTGDLSLQHISEWLIIIETDGVPHETIARRTYVADRLDLKSHLLNHLCASWVWAKVQSFTEGSHVRFLIDALPSSSQLQTLNLMRTPALTRLRPRQIMPQCSRNPRLEMRVIGATEKPR